MSDLVEVQIVGFLMHRLILNCIRSGFFCSNSLMRVYKQVCPCIFELLWYTNMFMDMNTTVFSTSLGNHIHLVLQEKSVIELRADQRLCFHYTDSTIPLLLKALAFSDFTGQLVSDFIRKP